MKANNKKIIASGIVGVALLSGGVDVGVYSGEELQPQKVQVSENLVDVKQKAGLVEVVMPWKDEAGFTIKYDLGTPSLKERVLDVREKNIIAEKVNFNESEGFKVDILLTEKPDTNTFCYQIEGYENYDFFYQPALTQQEIANGTVRAPEIDGSFAVYHKSKRDNQYLTGKVMHIPYPYIWEVGKEAQKVRADDFTYSNGNLCVVAPQAFLDNANYTNGVRIDPTFGYTSIGASSVADSITNTFNGSDYTVSENGRVDGIWVYVQSTLDQKAILTDSSGNILNGGIGSAFNSGGLSTWVRSSLPNVIITSGQTYWIGAISSNSFATQRFDTVASAGRQDTSNSFANPTSPTDAATNNRRHSIYATYSTGFYPIVDIKSNKIDVKSGVVNVK